MSSCFISDLHLDHKREDIKKAFFKFLESEASEFENLYILGDLFEVWIGDDFEDRFTSEVISELKKFNIPLILFGTFDETLTFKSYNVNIFLDKNYIKKFCWFLIFSILTKN